MWTLPQWLTMFEIKYQTLKRLHFTILDYIESLSHSLFSNFDIQQHLCQSHNLSCKRSLTQTKTKQWEIVNNKEETLCLIPIYENKFQWMFTYVLLFHSSLSIVICHCKSQFFKSIFTPVYWPTNQVTFKVPFTLVF